MANEYRVTWNAAEVLRDASAAPEQVFHISTEVLRDALGPVRLFDIYVEALRDRISVPAQVFGIYVEVLRSTATAVRDSGWICALW